MSMVKAGPCGPGTSECWGTLMVGGRLGASLKIALTVLPISASKRRLAALLNTVLGCVILTGTTELIIFLIRTSYFVEETYRVRWGLNIF